MNNLPITSILSAFHLPQRYASETYEDTDLPRTAISGLQQKIYKAPTSGTLLVSGTAGPIVNQLREMGRKTHGIPFTEYSTDQFKDEKVSLPSNKVEVVVVYGIGNEQAKNSEFSSRLLISMLDFYKSRQVLVIMETSLTITDFQTRYQIDTPTSIRMRLKKEQSWL